MFWGLRIFRPILERCAERRMKVEFFVHYLLFRAALAGSPKLQGEDDRGARLGTDGFISPEQAAGAGVDERADVYSLGALLRSMLAAPAPNRVEAIARKATAADRILRYPSVRALADDVSRYLDGAAVSAFPEGPLRRAARLASRHRVALGIVLAYLVGRSVMFFFVGR